MKRILTAAAALLFSVAMFAQSNDSPPPSSPQGGQQMRGGGHAPMTPEQRAKRETDQINALAPLGDAFTKVLDVNTQAAKKRESIMNGAKRSDMTEDQKAQLKALNESHKKDLKAAMGADLYAKYEAARKAQAEQKRNEGGGHPGGDGN
jgi:Spy/CpxP family protein refolding chaperone